MSERLQKALARAGYGSRRKLEIMISEGRVSVNGSIAVLGTKIEREDTVVFDGQLVRSASLFEKARLVIAYHKPEGEVCTRNDPEGRPTIFDRLPKISQGRWIAVGRLDVNTSGLILLTTDGELANRLMHPSSGIDREYLVRVHGNVTEEQLERLVDGVILDDGPARFTDIFRHPEADPDRRNQWFYVALMEGRNREVRRLWESQGLQVNRLKRVRYGCIFLPSFLKQGHFVELGQREVDDLGELVELPSLPVPKMTPQELKDVRRRLSKKSGPRKPMQKAKKPSMSPRRPSGRGR
ncbi:MAG: pseudouridine synthase [Pseudomonadota bacterium]|nr:pseudouridine synthase [Pseudomonadota bacterium]